MKFLEDEGQATTNEVEKSEVEEPQGEETAPIAEGIHSKVELEDYIRACYPLIYIRTEEDERAVGAVIKAFKSIEGRFGSSYYGEWKVTTGLKIASLGEFDVADREPVCTDLTSALKYVADKDEPHIVCFHNVRQFVKNVQVIQQIKDTVYAARLAGSIIIFIGPDMDIPPELNSLITVYELSLPNAELFESEFNDLLSAYQEKLLEPVDDVAIRRTAALAVGMTEMQGENAIALSIAKHRKLEPYTIQFEKEQAVKRGDVLEFVSVDRDIDDLGGFDLFKDWVDKRRMSMSPEAVAYGLTPPKGVLLVGVPGCGKSLAAKVVASYMGLPLLKLDMGRAFRSLVGASERAIQSALKIAEAVSPVVLWIEEIEKSLAGLQSSGASDSGTTARVISTLLTWMQERPRDSLVFVVATANEVGALPPEMLRKGRFSEVFGVIEPNQKEREEIWKIHIRRVRPNRLDEFDLEKLAKASDMFTGAEIEAVVEETMFNCFADGKREMQTEDLLATIKTVVPQSVTSKDKLDILRKWMLTKVRFVSSAVSRKEKSGLGSKKWRKLMEEKGEVKTDVQHN